MTIWRAAGRVAYVLFMLAVMALTGVLVVKILKS